MGIGLVRQMAKHDRSLDALFKALADPGRRVILERLMTGPASVGDLAAELDVALPTALGHLAKLETGGLVQTEKRGRTRICRADPRPLARAQDWLSAQRAVWDGRLDRLEAFLDTVEPDDDPRP